MNSTSTQEELNTNIIADGCPTWAQDLIAKILLLEIESGTIKNPTSSEASNDKASGWSTANLDELTKLANRLDRQGLQNLSEEIEAIFSRLATGLVHEGYSLDHIASMINSRIPTGCRLPYCNSAEIRDALS